MKTNSRWTRTLFYGGDYNPDQWPEKTVAEDVELMKKAHVNLVSLGIFSWARIEPEEGVFDFSWLDRVMDQLARAGIKVDLATPTAAPPVWAVKNHPDILPIDEKGITLHFGARQHYSPSSSTYRRLCVTIADKLAEHYAGHEALAMWHVGNEYGAHIKQSFDDEAVRRFRAWLETKYGDIDVLNDAWTTAFWSQHYSRFDEVDAPRYMPSFANPTHMQDWMRFSNDMLLECFLAEKQAIKAHTPNIPVTTNFMELCPALNYWQWANNVDVVADDSYPNPADPMIAARIVYTADLMSSLGRGKPYILMEQTPDMVQWKKYNAPKRPGFNELSSVARVAHGADGILHFQWRAAPGGAETFHGAMVPHCLESPTWAETVSLGQKLAKLREVAATKKEDADIAIVLDWDNIYAEKTLVGPTPFSHAQASKNWHQNLWEKNQRVDFVSVDDDLSQYRLVIVAQMPVVTDEFIAHLRQAHDAGTSIIITAPFDIVNENLRATLGGYGSRAKDFLGVRCVQHVSGAPDGVDYWTTPQPDMQVHHISAAMTTPSNCDHVDVVFEDPAMAQGILHGGHWAERLVIDDPSATVVARFGPTGAAADLHGEAAVVKMSSRDSAHAEKGPSDGGSVWYVATDADAQLIDRIVSMALTDAGMPVLKDNLPGGVEKIIRGDVTFILNWGEFPKTVATNPGTNIITGEVIDGDTVVVAGGDFAAIRHAEPR